MYFVSVSWKHKREEVKRVSQLSVFSVYRKTKGGSSCFSNLWQKREQKRWNGRSTPGNCVCSSHCVSFVVAQKIHIHKEVGDSFSSLQYYVTSYVLDSPSFNWFCCHQNCCHTFFLQEMKQRNWCTQRSRPLSCPVEAVALAELQFLPEKWKGTLVPEKQARRTY